MKTGFTWWEQIIILPPFQKDCPVSNHGHGRLADLMQQNATVLDRNMKHLWLENDIYDYFEEAVKSVSQLF